jgi:hypothetical protein
MMNQNDSNEEISTGELDDQNEEGVDAPPLPAEFTQLLGEWCQASDAHGIAHHQWKTLAIANATARAHNTQVSHDSHTDEQVLRFDAQAKNREVQQVQTQIEDWIKNAEGDKKAYAEVLEAVTEEMTILILARCTAQDRVDEAYEKMRSCESAFRPQSAAELLENDPDYKRTKAAYDSVLRARVSVGSRITTCTEQAAAGQTPTRADFALRELAAEPSKIPTFGPPLQPTRAPLTLADKVFAGGLIAKACDHLKDVPSLQWPDGAPQAMLLTRVDVKALRPGMVLPVLRFRTANNPAFDDLDSPAGYYVVISELQDGRPRLALAYRDPKYSGTLLPQCLIADLDGPKATGTILAFTDTAIRTGLADHISDALKKKFSPLLGPDTTITQRAESGGTGTHSHTLGRDSSLKTLKAFLPLRRALHNDKGKLERLLQPATELKLTDPALAVTIRNMHSQSGIQNLGALQPASIPHLLSFQYCVEPTFTGANKTPDALDLAAFMEQPNGHRPEFQGAFHIAAAYENMQRTYCSVMMEDRNVLHPHFRVIFRGPIDALREINLHHKLDNLPPNYLVWKCNQMNLQWAAQYRNEANEFLPEEAFNRVCVQALTIPVAEWMLEGNYLKEVPRQIYTPGKRPTNPGANVRQDKQQRGNPPKGAPSNPPKSHNPPLKGPAQKQSPPAPGANNSRNEICLKHLFYNADPTEYEDCKLGAKACPRIHNVKLAPGGKLHPKDKEDTRKALQGLPGKFGTKALAALDTLF